MRYLFTFITIFISSLTNAQMHNGHTYVDLGLSVKWATCNVGAKSPSNAGNCYAWGEIDGFNEGKKVYDLLHYKWCIVDVLYKYTKYCTDEAYGINDGLGILAPEDDAANVSLGGLWRIPTKEELEELQNNCTWKWTQLNKKNGYRVISKKNGKSIFLPVTGCRFDEKNSGPNDFGSYWSSSLDMTATAYAWEFSFSKPNSIMPFSILESNRHIGRYIRPVCP